MKKILILILASFFKLNACPTKLLELIKSNPNIEQQLECNYNFLQRQGIEISTTLEPFYIFELARIYIPIADDKIICSEQDVQDLEQALNNSNFTETENLDCKRFLYQIKQMILNFKEICKDYSNIPPQVFFSTYQISLNQNLWHESFCKLENQARTITNKNKTTFINGHKIVFLSLLKLRLHTKNIEPLKRSLIARHLAFLECASQFSNLSEEERFEKIIFANSLNQDPAIKINEKFIKFLWKQKVFTSDELESLNINTDILCNKENNLLR